MKPSKIQSRKRRGALRSTLLLSPLFCAAGASWASNLSVGAGSEVSAFVAVANGADSGLGGNEKGQARMSRPTHGKTIELPGVGRGSLVRQLTFSPDGRYLAVLENPPTNDASIIIWDLNRGVEQARIKGLATFANSPQRLLWSPNGKYITFGIGNGADHPMHCWDPMTGGLVVDVPIGSNGAHFNHDGTELLTTVADSGHWMFRIYETNGWSFKEYGLDGMRVIGAVWGPDGQVFVVGDWNVSGVGVWNKGVSPSPPGRLVLKPSDAIVQIIDPSGRSAVRAVVLAPSNPTEIRGINHTVYESTMSIPFLATDQHGTKLALGMGSILNMQTLELVRYASEEDLASKKIPNVTRAANAAFSPDGSLLFLKGDAPMGSDDSARNIIVDANSGQLLSSFEGGHDGIAISSNGKQLAIGSQQSFKLFDLLH